MGSWCCLVWMGVERGALYYIPVEEVYEDGWCTYVVLVG